MADRSAAAGLLAELLAPGDVVLVKASRSYGLEVLAAHLLDPHLLEPDPLTDGTTGTTGKGTA